MTYRETVSFYEKELLNVDLIDFSLTSSVTDATRNNVVLFFISPVVVVCFTVILASYVVIARAVRLQSQLRVRALQPQIQRQTAEVNSPRLIRLFVVLTLRKIATLIFKNCPKLDFFLIC